MKLATAMTILGVNLWAGQPIQDAPGVTVCLMGAWKDTLSVYHALSFASRMYSQIGVTIDWHSNGNPCSAPEAVNIELTDRTPATLLPGALAYALVPYKGIHIRVFLDRVQDAVNAETRPYLLAHVLVHEIGHVLQGDSRHSETGVMKAHWTTEDYNHMAFRPLTFTAEDLVLIHKGIKERTPWILAKKARAETGSAEI